ncbi:uncharacterized protein LOC142980221 [Anticarsia gemmatalis]|uniref:uncharacterized protein LOC142980221 n=1 Tax=Anticarsia gemmatalis TaxID=129554 RepID=UPI003F75959D
MKLLFVVAVLVAVASADFIKPTPISEEQAQLQEIIAAIEHPATDPATAAALQQMLLEMLGVKPPSPVIIDDAVVDNVDFVDIFPVFDEVAPAPAASSSPLVQIIVNVNEAPDGLGPIVSPTPPEFL